MMMMMIVVVVVVEVAVVVVLLWCCCYFLKIHYFNFSKGLEVKSGRRVGLRRWEGFQMFSGFERSLSSQRYSSRMEIAKYMKVEAGIVLYEREYPAQYHWRLVGERCCRMSLFHCYPHTSIPISACCYSPLSVNMELNVREVISYVHWYYLKGFTPTCLKWRCSKYNISTFYFMNFILMSLCWYVHLQLFILEYIQFGVLFYAILTRRIGSQKPCIQINHASFPDTS